MPLLFFSFEQAEMLKPTAQKGPYAQDFVYIYIYIPRIANDIGFLVAVNCKV